MGEQWLRYNWKKLLLRVASYVLVAALASTVTLFAVGGTSKLIALERVIRQRFVGTMDETAMEDAAAVAMVASLGDRWSYYISAEEYASYEERKTNSYVGIGISISKREDGTGCDIVAVEDFISEFTVEGYNERAFISLNSQKVNRLEVDDGNEVQVINIDSDKPFAIVLPMNAGSITFYDIDGNVVKYANNPL